MENAMVTLMNPLCICSLLNLPADPLQEGLPTGVGVPDNEC
jgi:hypothetical protein